MITSWLQLTRREARKLNFLVPWVVIAKKSKNEKHMQGNKNGQCGIIGFWTPESFVRRKRIDLMFYVAFVTYLSRSGEPLIDIYLNLPVGPAIILTCTAWQTDELAARYRKTRPQRIRWLDPQGRFGKECQAGTPAAVRMDCTWIVYPLTAEKFGNYTCKASNGWDYCSSRRFPVRLHDQGNYR